MSEAAPNNLTLSVLSGPSAGESYALEGAVGHVIMGSGESAHIQFESPVVAANHVRIAIDEQGAAVAPASPDAAVFLNDDPVTDDIPLKNGDILWMGNPGDEGAVMIQCHLEAAGPVVYASEESELPPAEAETAMAEESPIEAQPEEEAFAESPFEAQPEEAAFVASPGEAQPEEGAFEESPVETQPEKEAFAESPFEAQPKAEAFVESLGEAAPQEEAFAESEPIAEPDVVAREPADAVEVQSAGTTDFETVPEPSFEPEAPPEAMVVEESESKTVEAAEFEATSQDSDQETVFLGASEPPPAVSEPQPEASAEDLASSAEPEPSAEPDFAVAEELAAPSPEAVVAAIPPDEPQPWEEQPEDSVKAAWEVEQPPQPPAPAGREDLEKPAEAAVAPPATAEAPPPPAPAKPATAKPATKPAVRRPPTRPATRTSRPATRPTPPPAASSSGKTIGIAAGVIVVVGGAVAAFFMFGGGGSEPDSTAPPVTVAQTLAPPTTLSVTEDEIPLDEMPDDGMGLGEDADAFGAGPEDPLTAPDPQPTPPPVTQVAAATPAPTPDRAAAARLLRERQAGAAAPTPRPRATPAPATPAPAAQPSAAERQAQQVSTLLGQADQAMAANDYAGAQSLYEAVLKLEPSNAKATAGASQAAASAAAANKSFVAGRTVYVSKGKKGSGPVGFATEGAADPDYKGSLTIEMTPPKARPGAAFTARVFLTNEGTKNIEPKDVSFTTRINGERASSKASSSVRQVQPGQRALVAETTGTWQPGTQSWIFEATVTAGRGDTYRSRLTWR